MTDTQTKPTKESLLQLGFKEHNHFTIGNMIYYELDRHRQITISSLGTPNEMVSICELEPGASVIAISDVVILHNYDYDGYITTDWITNLIKLLNL